MWKVVSDSTLRACFLPGLYRQLVGHEHNLSLLPATFLICLRLQGSKSLQIRNPLKFTDEKVGDIKMRVLLGRYWQLTYANLLRLPVCLHASTLHDRLVTQNYEMAM